MKKDESELRKDIERAIAIRAKHLGITLDMAKDPRSVTVVGRMFLRKEITNMEFNAAQYFYYLHNEYFRAKGYPSAVYPNDKHVGRNYEEAMKVFKKVEAKYIELLKSLVQAKQKNPLVVKALQKIVLDNQEVSDLFKPLKLALEHLEKYFNLRRRKWIN